MWISDRLIYLQLEKTASSHITSLFNTTLDGRMAGKHNRLPRRYLIENRLVVGSIRNPWDWYLSLWGFGCRAKGGLYLRQTNRKLRGHGFSGHTRYLGCFISPMN